MEYWRTTGPHKQFHCPFDVVLFREHVPLEARVLDYGTGYGRLLQQLENAGYRTLTGVDASPEMVALARVHVTNATILTVKPSEVPFADDSFDAVVLYSVLSSLLTLDEQRTLVAELSRVLRPGGVLYLNDFAVQRGSRDVKRYREGYALGKQQHGDTVFVDPQGAYAFYHFSAARLELLFKDYGLIKATLEPTRSMNGSLRSAFQLLLRRGTESLVLPSGVKRQLKGGGRVDQPA